MKTKIALMIALFPLSCFAQPENDRPTLSMEKQFDHLNKVNFHPNLLPIILRNSDFLDLSPKQISDLKAWGKANFKPMVATMNEIIRKRIEFEEASLSHSVEADTLRKKQEEIFQLHRILLDYKLSCRSNLEQTFNEENWESFLMVLGEEGFPIPDNVGATQIARVSIDAPSPDAE